MKLELFLAWRYLFRGNRRHISFIGIVSCLGIALGVATLVIVISVMNGFDRDLTERLMRFNYHIIIEGDSENLTELAKIMRSWDDGLSVSQFAQTQVFAKFDDIIFPLMVRGIDFNDKEEIGLFYKYVNEDSGKDGFFVGNLLSRKFNADRKIEFYPLEKNLKLHSEDIRGVFEVGLYDIDSNYIITDLEKAKSLSSNYLLFMGVRLEEPFTAHLVKSKIKNNFNASIFVTTWMESNRVLFSALKLEKITMFIILSLIILVAAFNIFAILSVKVVEKTKDIGILRSLGFNSGKILNIFSFQGLILGVVGTICGIFIGLGLCFILSSYSFIKLPEEIYFMDYLPVAINYRDIFLIGFVGIFLSYIFSLLPAARAARLPLSKALRYE